MADQEEDQEQEKTEEPTQRRLEESQKEGQFPFSKEINHCFILVGGIVIFAILPTLSQDLLKILRYYIEQAPLVSLEGPDIQFFCTQTVLHSFRFLMAPFGILIIAVLMATFLQSRLVLKEHLFQMELEKISPLKGFKRIFSKKSVIEFLKGIVKIILVTLVFYIIFKKEIIKFSNFFNLDTLHLSYKIQHLTHKLFLGVLGFMIIIAGADYLKERFDYFQKMRMTRQAIKEEIKQTEGDPSIRARLRQLRRQRSQRRMMTAVPSATVIITNPTHYAVALKFEQESMEAPVVVAKGMDLIAQKIREIAQEHEIPIIENPPLAQALFKEVEIDEEIPSLYYEAVAPIISYVLQQRPKRV
jgi:flagellar biosynthetic protein FlhB